MKWRFGRRREALEERLDKARAALAARDVRIADRDARIAERDARIAKRDGWIADLEARIAEREARIAELRAGWEAERARAKTAAAASDAMLAQAGERVAELEASLTATSAKLSELEVAHADELRRLRSELFLVGRSRAACEADLRDVRRRCERLAGDTPQGIERRERPALRLVHHLACTGGTLIARCIAALPNTRLLSEVDPLSEIAHENSKFFPSDLIGLAKCGSRPPGSEVLVDIFRGGLDPLYEDSTRSGLDLVLRDHSHGHFCYGPDIPERPTLRELLAGGYDLRGVVTVRHPLDSFLALQSNGWLHFEQPTPEEYARRYHAFLDRHAGLPSLKYEDFLSEPEVVMQQICDALDLVYDPGFRHLFGAVRLSGDSGRSGDHIAPRPRRPCPESLLEEAKRSTAFMDLLDRLGYPEV